MISDGRESPELRAAADAVVAADGEWVLIRSDVNGCNATLLRQGRRVAFRPPERFEFRAVRMPGYARNRVDVWARLRTD